jgi:glycosyltransferase involved in cell wall biosynthesis
MKILTLSSVFPNPQQPLLGLFVRERLCYVARRVQVRVVAPVPWSPFDGLARALKPGFRPARPGGREDHGLLVEHPRFLCFPGLLKGADGWLYYRSLLAPLGRLRREYPFELIDAHFAYPDGLAAALLARRFGVPFTVTLRGTEAPYSRSRTRRPQIEWVLRRASRVISVSRSLACVAEALRCPQEKIHVIPNGVDSLRFQPLGQAQCRRRLGLPERGRVLLSVGGLVERKGFHRVIALLPELRRSFPELVYVIVGGPSVEGDFSGRLRAQVAGLGLDGCVRFEGSQPPDALPGYYSAADVFVLATANEGWANVLLESLACGTPVVTTEVGGNREVVCEGSLGSVVPFGDPEALRAAIEGALGQRWERERLVEYARARDWGLVAQEVVEVFEEMVRRESGAFSPSGRIGFVL